VVDFPGPAPAAALERLIAERHLGGVVVFRKNVESPAQVRELTDALQAVASAAGAPPLWIAIDHEGGAVNRFGREVAGGRGTPRVTPLPSPMALGAAGSAALARRAGLVAGRELRAVGIHQNYAPAVDVNNNPANPIIGARAFGESPALVESLGLAYIDGLQAAGVAATVKHFPGHGDVTVDSHLALPRVDHPVARLERVELPPFAAAMRAGVAAVMPAHIVYPALDPSEVPATMSAPILTGLARERWGFEGLICSDSLQMRAIVDHYGVGDAAVAAVRAGCDQLLALGPEALQREVMDALAMAIERGEVPANRIAEARRRVEAAVQKWGPGAPAGAGAPEIDDDAHDRVAREIAEGAVTLVRDRAGIVPLRGPRIGVASVSPGYGENEPPDLAAALRRHHADVRDVPAAGPRPEVDQLVAVTFTRGTPSATQVATIRDLHKAYTDRLVVVATGDPYDLLQFPEIPAYLVTYGPDAPSLDAGARVLVGALAPRGRLPVTLPGLHRAGTGLAGRG
jgi:beta-N-acetylhexosaminidase